MKQSQWLTLDEVIQALRELEGEADWQDIENLVTHKRGGGHEPYLDWGNYTTTMRQLFQERCKGYRKYKGPELFHKVRERPLRYRLLDFERDKSNTGLAIRLPAVQPPETKQINVSLSIAEAEDINEPPARVQFATYRIIRDTALSREIKELHKYRCQVCHQDALRLGGGKLYAEAHHIKPLGSPHNGLDVRENILCVCPNCHVLLDFGAIKLNISKLKVNSAHRVGAEYIEYHNTSIYDAIEE